MHLSTISYSARSLIFQRVSDLDLVTGYDKPSTYQKLVQSPQVLHLRHSALFLPWSAFQPVHLDLVPGALAEAAVKH